MYSPGPLPGAQEDESSRPQIVFLLGAGASVAAGVPAVRKMTEQFVATLRKESPELSRLLERFSAPGGSAAIAPNFSCTDLVVRPRDQDREQGGQGIDGHERARQDAHAAPRVGQKRLKRI